MSRKVGLLGGSFNPVHCGHVALAKQLLRAAGLDEVWLMVSPQNPWKQEGDLLDEGTRYALASRAVAHEPGLSATDYEQRLPRPSYTWNTLQHLAADYPDHEFVLLIGGDNWAQFSRWSHADDILRHYRIVVYPRPDCELPAPPEGSHVEIVPLPLIPLSSTEIRQRVKQHLPITGMVPKEIEAEVEQAYGKN